MRTQKAIAVGAHGTRSVEYLIGRGATVAHGEEILHVGREWDGEEERMNQKKKPTDKPEKQKKKSQINKIIKYLSYG